MTKSNEPRMVLTIKEVCDLVALVENCQFTTWTADRVKSYRSVTKKLNKKLDKNKK